MTTDIVLQRCEVISSAVEIEGIWIKTYGIEYKNVRFGDLSDNREAVESLARRIEACDVSAGQLGYIADDFLTMLYGLRNTSL